MYQLAVAVKEEGYIKRLADYVRSSPQGGEWRITGFTSAAALRQYMKGGYAVDMMLAAPEFMEEAFAFCAPSVIKLALVLRPGEARGINTGTEELLQYQPLPQLLREIADRRLAGKPHAAFREAGRGDGTKVAAVYSAAGGIGKTVTALNMAHQAAVSGLNVFYLNLEPYDATPLLLGGVEEEGLSRLLYALKSQPETAGDLLRKLRKQHPVLRADFLPGGSHPDERFAMTPEDAGKLLQLLRTEGGYDLIVVDLDSVIQDFHRVIFEASTTIVWLTTRDAIVRRKTEIALQYIERGWPEIREQLMNAVCWVQTRMLDGIQPDGDGRDTGRMPVTGILPYVPEWKWIQPGQLLGSMAFQAAIVMLLDKLCLKGGEAVVACGGRHPAAAGPG
ncbi:P-loop NTPase family protein [Paenibacillus tarimensis]|uniref:hypothetical protein n=1 Tax=Paenibacillus tarimensis TaxID=416012 RepID=UPI001F3039EC|nr:hypothetical protein [Paenibacillus tarimensis]MCF2943538.1 hypothetical protein [Paenibacillus tarimensis]